MKTKLLKKVRKKFYIEKRNNEYRLVELKGIFNVKEKYHWIESIDRVRSLMRYRIEILYTEKYKVGKEIIEKT